MFTIFVLLNIRDSLDFWTIRTIVVAFVTSRLDYANSVLYGIPAKYISRQTLLQRTQNTLARVVAGTHNWNFGGMNRAFKPERQNKNQILIIWKPLSRSWQKFLQGYAPWMRLRGWAHIPQQIQDDERRPSWISWNDNIFAADEDICTKFGGKMHHGHAEMITWPKIETGS